MVAMPNDMFIETLKTAATYRFLNHCGTSKPYFPHVIHSTTIHYIMTGFLCGVKHYQKIDVTNLFFLVKSYVISDISKNVYSGKSATRRNEPKPN